MLLEAPPFIRPPADSGDSGSQAADTAQLANAVAALPACAARLRMPLAPDEVGLKLRSALDLEAALRTAQPGQAAPQRRIGSCQQAVRPHAVLAAATADHLLRGPGAAAVLRRCTGVQAPAGQPHRPASAPLMRASESMGSLQLSQLPGILPPGPPASVRLTLYSQISLAQHSGACAACGAPVTCAGSAAAALPCSGSVSHRDAAMSCCTSSMLIAAAAPASGHHGPHLSLRVNELMYSRLDTRATRLWRRPRQPTCWQPPGQTQQPALDMVWCLQALGDLLQEHRSSAGIAVLALAPHAAGPIIGWRHELHATLEQGAPAVPPPQNHHVGLSTAASCCLRCDVATATR